MSIGSDIDEYERVISELEDWENEQEILRDHRERMRRRRVELSKGLKEGSQGWSLTGTPEPG